MTGASPKSSAEDEQPTYTQHGGYEEYGLEIVYTKGIHNTVADAISLLEYNPAPIISHESCTDSR